MDNLIRNSNYVSRVEQIMCFGKEIVLFLYFQHVSIEILFIVV